MSTTADESSAPTSQGAATILFDFDGTICLGAGPVIVFSQTLDSLAPGHEFERRVRDFLADPDAKGPYSACDDPYDVVAIAAADAGLPRELTDAAYTDSRTAASRSDVRAPADFADFIRSLPVDCVLVTNSPAREFAVFLERLELVGAFSTVVTSAGKPAGMHAVVREHLANGPVLSVGDKWVNDLAPARFLGADTAIVDTFGRRLDKGRATFRAHVLELLYPQIRGWCESVTRSIPPYTTKEVDHVSH